MSSVRSSPPAPSTAEGRWRRFAQCAGVDPDVFFPPAEKGALPAWYYDRAKRLCAACVVRTQCLEDAIASGEDAAFRGGCTPAQLKSLIRIERRNAT